MTKDEITKAVIAELGLQDITAFDETGYVNNWVYNGTVDLLARTRCTVRCVHLNINAGKGQYTLDHKILALVEVEDGDRRRLRRDEQHWYDENDFVVVGQDPAYQLSGRGFTLIRSDVLVVKPTPSEDGYIDVWAVLRPSPMVLATDSPADEPYGAIPFEFHDAIVTYAMWKGSSYSDDQSAQQGERYRMLYEGQDGRGGRLAQIKTQINKRGTARAPRARVRLRGVHNKMAWTG